MIESFGKQLAADEAKLLVTSRNDSREVIGQTNFLSFIPTVRRTSSEYSRVPTSSTITSLVENEVKEKRKCHITKKQGCSEVEIPSKSLR
jgi:hypothetical protein